MSLNSRLKVTKIRGQRKPFFRQIIPESSCARKETVDIDILVKSRNGDRKTMQSVRITSKPTSRKKEVEPVETLLKNIYQSNTYRKDLDWPHFNDEARVQEKLQKYCKDLLFWVLWACLLMATKTMVSASRKLWFLSSCKKLNLCLTSFFPRFCNFVTLGTSAMPGHPHQNNSIFL